MTLTAHTGDRALAENVGAPAAARRADAAPALTQHSTGGLWRWAIGTIPLLLYLLWAGSAPDPRHAILWTWTATRWLAPAPGLGHVWIASALLFAVLSRLAAGALACGAGSVRWRSITAGGILIVAVLVRVMVLRWWTPLPLDAASLAGKAAAPVDLTRWPQVLADLLTVLLLLAACSRTQRCLYLAALYALHPLALFAVAEGSRVLLLLPAVVLAGMFASYLRPWVRVALIVGLAAFCVARLAVTTPLQPAYNGLLAESLTAFGVTSAGGLRAALVAIEIIFQGLIVALALRRKWPLALAWGHVLLAWALVAPRVLPADVLPILALVPLAWTRAGWVLSLTVLSASAGVLFTSAAGGPALPRWLIIATMLPVLIVEVEALFLHVVRPAAPPEVPAPA